MRTICRYFLGLVVTTLSCSQLPANAAEDLTALSLEELLQIEITSVSKKAQSLVDAAAAVFVVTNDDIQRSGATSIPEVLRMVPGIQVSQNSASKYSVSARGFNSRFANKLLVLIDGRTVYNPSFSGVYWEHQDVVLEDVDRIEVIRGPGATLWGANAVNGVINIITRSAEATQGGLLSISAGNEESILGALRLGGEIAPDVFARAYIKYSDRDASVNVGGNDGADAWDIVQGGFRIDSRAGDVDSFRLQGDLYSSDLEQALRLTDPLSPPTTLVDDAVEASGWNLLAEWNRVLTPRSDFRLAFYVDHVQRREAYVYQEYDVYDLEFEHRVTFAERHDLVWGLGYRRIEDRFESTTQITVDPDFDGRDIWSGFIQDDIEFMDDRLRLTFGSKFEHNDYTGFEIQPNARLLWRPSEDRAYWASISRAVRTPSRAENDADLWARWLPASMSPLGFPAPQVYQTAGNDEFKSEELLAYEMGYRASITEQVNLDLALFYNEYDNLRSFEVVPPNLFPIPAYYTVDLRFDNQSFGTTHGLELALDWQVTERWRISPAYTYLELDLELRPGSTDSTIKGAEGSSPKHQLSLRSSSDLKNSVQLDIWVRYVDEVIPGIADALEFRRTDAYWDLDVRLAWRPRSGVELSLVGQNLLESAHQEGFLEAFGGGNDLQIERGVYAKLRMDF